MKRNRYRPFLITVEWKEPNERFGQCYGAAETLVHRRHLTVSAGEPEFARDMGENWARRFPVGSVVTVVPKKHKRLAPSRLVPLSGDAAKAYVESRAIAYVQWLMQRDGIEIPHYTRKHRIEWSGVYSKTRKVAGGRAMFEKRIAAVSWGYEEDVHNIRKDGRRGAFLYRKFVPELTVAIPNWDWQPDVPVEVVK